MEKTMQGRARAGWQDRETERLFQAVDEAAREGQPLRHVFESLSGELGRKPNSIRNYYYARLRQHPESTVQRAAPFQTFTQEEVRASCSMAVYFWKRANASPSEGWVSK